MRLDSIAGLVETSFCSSRLAEKPQRWFGDTQTFWEFLGCWDEQIIAGVARLLLADPPRRLKFRLCDLYEELDEKAPRLCDLLSLARLRVYARCSVGHSSLAAPV